MRTLRKRHFYILALAALTLGFHLCAGLRPLMNALAEGTLAVKQVLGQLCGFVPFSVAEALCVLAITAAAVYLVWSAVSILRAKKRGAMLWRRASALLAVLLTVYFLLCLFLGASYRADGFQEKSGLRARPSTLEALYGTTEWFVEALRDSYDRVARDEAGRFAVPSDRIYDSATEVYRGAEALYPFLTLKDAVPKRLVFSKLLSRFNYTGVYFPFTGEANINADAPACLTPATIAHEMAHQRGVASEQEANFVAVLACTESGDPVYTYSGWLFGFLHLGSALYRHAPERYAELAARLPAEVWADIESNNAYWARFDTAAAAVSEKVYDAMLKSYGQSLGVQSYGAVVDLLIAWREQTVL